MKRKLFGLKVWAIALIVAAACSGISIGINGVPVLVQSQNGGFWPKATFAGAVASADTANKTIYVMGYTPITGTVTVPSTIAVKVVFGGYFSGGTLAVNGPFEAGDYQVFSGTTVTLPGAAEAPVLWWGAKGDDSTDCTAAFRSAVAALTSGNVVFKQGSHKVTDTVTISKPFINVVGLAKGARGISTVHFVPSSGKACLLFDAVTAGHMYHNAVRDIAFNSLNADGDYTKIGIETKDADTLTIENVSMVYWYGSTNSIALKCGGRQFIRVRNFTAYADKPIYIGQNPYRADVADIDIDQSIFTNLYLVAGSGPCVTIASGVNLTNVTFDGHQSWTSNGSYGLYWLDTTSTGVSANLNINNVRNEHDSDAGSYMFYINVNSGLQNLMLTNIYGGLTQKGIYLRKVANASITNWYYVSNSNEALNVDSTVAALSLRNVYTQSGSTATLTGQQLIYATPQATGGLPRSAEYAAASEVITQLRVNKPIAGDVITVANNATTTLCTDTFRGVIVIADSEGASAVYFINGPLHTTVESSDGSGLYSPTAATASSTNIYWDAGSSSYLLQNKRGDFRNYYITRLGG